MAITNINMKHIEIFSFDGFVDFSMAINFKNLKELEWSDFIQEHKNTLERNEIKDADFLMNSC